MAVRKRRWTSSSGIEREAWIFDYTDAKGRRHIKTFDRKKDADAWAAKTTVAIRSGAHVPESETTTVAAAGQLWIATGESAGLERTTIDQRRQHIQLHINPFLGRLLLSRISVPVVRSFSDRLRAEGRSLSMTRKVLASLSALLSDAQERGLVAHNAAREMSGRTLRDNAGKNREKGRLRVGLDIPTLDEVRRILAVSKGRFRPLLLMAVFTGMRASELRGLSWGDVDLNAQTVRVTQRADRYNTIGNPKSYAGHREIPLPPIVANTLREWKLVCPKSARNLVFPNSKGNIESHANIINRGFVPAQIEAGILAPADPAGPVDERRAKYTGLHALRHFYASWCINRRVDGGLELPAKVVQERLGHSSIIMTMDTYGHLFPRGDDSAELAAAEALLFA